MKQGEQMRYQEARDFITQSAQYGSKLGLEAITELLRRMGNPQDTLKVLHVAGTNGKGSTSSFLSTILAMEGYRVGRFHSPAVFEYLEMVQITAPSLMEGVSTAYISESEYTLEIAKIKQICSQMLREGLPHPTSFEIETAMALSYLSKERVDFAVIEVGLGGRLDATNVFQKPLCNIITSISLDHMQYLGDTLAKIAYEKAGIIKNGARVITSNTEPEVLKVLEQVSIDCAATLTIADAKEAKGITYGQQGTLFHYKGKQYRIKLLGQFQIMNAVLAIDTMIQLRELGYRISESSVQRGLEHTSWSGRFEVIAKHPYFVIDGAHNADASLQLRKTLLTYFKENKKIYILGVLADKDYKAILENTADLADLLITITPNNDRALASSQLAKEASAYTKGEVIDAGECAKAVEIALHNADQNDIIIAFGSLSYLSQIKSILTR